MKKRKVLISALLAAAVVSTATLTSCGDKEENKKTETTAGDQTTTTGDQTTTTGDTPTSTTSGSIPTSTTSGSTPTSTTSGSTPTSTTSDVAPTSSTSEIDEAKATLRLHYNGADLDEVSESIEFELTEDDGTGKYAEIPSDKLNVRDSYRQFKGWFTDKALTIEATSDQKSYIDQDIDLYAKWESVAEMTTFDLNATTDLSAGALANDYKKGIYTVKAGTTMRSASPTGAYATGYTQEIQGNGNMQVYISPVADTKLNVIFCQRSTGSISTADIYEVAADGTVSTQSVYQIACKEADGTRMASNATGKAEINLTGGKTYLLKGTGGTCSILDINCEYEVTPSPVDNIEVISAPIINLIEGESYDATTAAGKINFENGTSQDLAAGEFEVDFSQVDSSEEGIYTVQIKYAPEEYIYNKLKDKTYTADITVKVFSIQEIILGFNATEKGANTTSGNGTYVNNTVKTIYQAGDQFDPTYLSVKARGTLGEGDTAEEYIKALSTKEYEVDKVGENVTATGDVTVVYTTNDQIKEATYKIYVVDALDVTQSVYNVKVDPHYIGNVGAYSQNAYQFNTINQAMNFLRLYQDTANYEEKSIVLTIAAGYYNEKVEFDLPNMTVKGAGRVNKAINTGFNWTNEEIASKTIIEWDSINGQPDESGYIQQTDSSATVAVRETAVNFYISDVTISNNFNSFDDFVEYYGDRPNQSQALALLVQSDKFVMYNSDLHGYQDTLETFTGRQVFIDTLISGTTDFIFGTNGSTYFYNCEIRCISPAQIKDGFIQYNIDGGYINAFKGNNKGADDAIEWGAVYDGCDFTAEKYVRNIDGYTAQIKLEDKSYAEYETVDYDGKYFTRVDTTTATPVAGTTYYTFIVNDGNAVFTEVGEVTAWVEGTQYATAETITTGNTSIARPWGTNSAVTIMNSTLGGHISLLDYDYIYTAVAAGSVKTKYVLTTQYSYFSKVDTTTTTAPASGTTYYTLVDDVFTVAADITAWAENTDYYTLAGTKKVDNDYKTEDGDNVYHATAIDGTTSYTHVANPDKKAVTNATYYTANGEEIAPKSDYNAETTYYERKDPSDSKNLRYVTMSGNSPMLATNSFIEYNNSGSGAGPVVSKDIPTAFSTFDDASDAPNQDIIFGRDNGKVSFIDTWRGVYTTPGAAYGKVIAKDAHLLLNLVGENNSYYEVAVVTDGFKQNKQYYVLNGDNYEAIDVNVYAFKTGVDYYYDKTVYTAVAADKVKVKAKLNDNYSYFTKADTTKDPVAGTTYYTIVENIFTVTEVTEWVTGTTYYVLAGTRKVGEDVKAGTNFHATYDEETNTYTYVETPAQYDVLNEQYYNEDGSVAYEKGKEPYDSTKTYYTKGTEKALVEATTVDKTIKYYLKDGDTYTELAFNSTNFDVALETPEEGTTYYVTNNVITLKNAFYRGISISEEELTTLYNAYRENNPSLADFDILGIYADAAMTTEYTFPALGLNNNTIYLEVGTSAIVDSYIYNAAAATNPDWTFTTSDTSTKMFIPYQIGGTIAKNGTGDNGVSCAVIKNNGEDCVTSKTLGIGVRAVNVTIVGGTTDSGDARFKVVAYDAAGTELAKVYGDQVEGSNAKTTTHFFTSARAVDSKGNLTIPVVLADTVTTDIAYVKVFVCHKATDDINNKVNGILSIDLEVLYDTNGIIFKNYVADIDFPAVAAPWIKDSDGTAVTEVNGFTATYIDGLIKVDATTGKVNSRASSWAQFNTGAKIIFNVAAGAKVSFNTYSNAAAKYSINGGEAVTPTGKNIEFTVDHVSVIVIEALAGDYISDITVTFE